MKAPTGKGVEVDLEGHTPAWKTKKSFYGTRELREGVWGTLKEALGGWLKGKGMP